MELRTGLSKEELEIHKHLIELAHWQAIQATLLWDQETQLPQKAYADRSEHLALLSGRIYDLSVASALEENLDKLLHRSELNESRREYAVLWDDLQKRKKLNRGFVEQLSRASSAAFEAWENGRLSGKTKAYLDALQVIIGLKQEEAHRMGYAQHPYDALLDGFEPGCTTSEVQHIFKTLEPILLNLAKQYPFSTFTYAASALIAPQKQIEFGKFLMDSIGIDFQRGRMDLSSHPFTIKLGMHDIRFTTRADANDPDELISSCMHEGGHALYEQGLDPQHFGMPSGEPASLAFHEAMSRMWENQVGRSLTFWEANYANLVRFIPELSTEFKDAESYFRHINRLRNTLIRTQADELHYHLHIGLRFRLEVALMDESLSVKHLEEAWNEETFRQFGRYPQNPTEGILQDVHWAHGSIGYFPTYTLGSLYAAQLFAKANEALPILSKKLGEAEMAQLLGWLRENLFCYGRNHKPAALCKQICGSELDPYFFTQYLENKLSLVYAH